MRNKRKVVILIALMLLVLAIGIVFVIGNKKDKVEQYEITEISPNAVKSVISNSEAQVDTLYSQEVGNNNVVTMNKLWPSNAVNGRSIQTYRLEGNENSNKKYMQFDVTTKDNLKAGAHSLEITIDSLNIDTSKYDDIRINLDYIARSYQDNILNVYSFEAYVEDTNGNQYGPYGIYDYEVNGVYQDVSTIGKTIEVYTRGYNLVTENIVTEETKDKTINKIILKPHGNLPSIQEEKVIENYRNPSRFNLASIDIKGYKNGVYNKASYKSEKTINVDETREKAIQKIYQYSTIKWSPNKTFSKYFWRYETNGFPAYIYIKDETIYGMPYTQANRVNFEKFKSILTSDGKYILPEGEDFEEDYVYRAFWGADCSMSVYYPLAENVNFNATFGCIGAIWDRSASNLLGDLQIKGTDSSSENVVRGLQQEYDDKIENKNGKNLDENEIKIKEKAESILSQRLKSNCQNIKFIENDYIAYFNKDENERSSLPNGENLKLYAENLGIENKTVNIKVRYEIYGTYDETAKTAEEGSPYSPYDPLIKDKCKLKVYNYNNQGNKQYVNDGYTGGTHTEIAHSKNLALYEYSIDLSAKNINNLEFLPYGETTTERKSCFRLVSFSINTKANGEEDYKEEYCFGINELTAYFDLDKYMKIETTGGSNEYTLADGFIPDIIVNYLNGEENEELHKNLISKILADQKMCKGYKQLLLGDVIATSSRSGGLHIRMITGNVHIEEDEDGFINPAKSYVLKTDIGGALVNTDALHTSSFGQVNTNYVDAYVGGKLSIKNGKVVNANNKVIDGGVLKLQEYDGTDVAEDFSNLAGQNLNYYINNINTFASLCYRNYLPVRVNAFETGKVEEPYALLTNYDVSANDIRGTISTNYNITSINFKVIDKNGKEKLNIVEYPNNSYRVEKNGEYKTNSTLETMWTTQVYSLYYNLPTNTKEDILDCLNNNPNSNFTITVNTGKENIVIDANSSNLTINNAPEKLDIGESFKIETNTYPITYTGLTYTSSNTDVARVNKQGVVRAVGEGTATITVTSESGVSTTCVITVTQNELIQAVLAVADSYRDRGLNIQYEQRLKTMAVAPEEATEDNILYMQCAGFTWDVYYEALGISIPILCSQVRDEIKENGSEYSVICIDGEDLSQYNNKVEDFIKDYGNRIMPGDVVILDGHFQMIYSLEYDEYGDVVDAILIHSTTAGIPNHATENHTGIDGKQEGSIQIVKLKNYFQKWMNGTDNDSDNNKLILLRPTINGKTWKNPLTGKYPSYPKILTINGEQWGNHIDENGVETYSITDKAKDRMKYKGIYISKTDNYKNKTVVPVDSEITYTITITNPSEEDYEGITIRELLPEGTEYISGGDKIENGVVIWENKTIPVGQTLEYTFVVKVLPTTEKGTIIISKGKVNNIDTTTVRNIVGNIYNSNEINTLKTKVSDTTNSKSGLEFVDEVYNKAFGIDLGLRNINSLQEVLIKTTEHEAKIVGLTYMQTLLYNDSEVDRIWRNRYDLNYYLNHEHNSDIVQEINLQPGQIILTSRKSRTTGEEEINAYIYLGDKLVGKTSDGIIEYLHNEEITKPSNTKVSQIDYFLENQFFAFHENYGDSTSLDDENYTYTSKVVVINPANLKINKTLYSTGHEVKTTSGFLGSTAINENITREKINSITILKSNEGTKIPGEAKNNYWKVGEGWNPNANSGAGGIYDVRAYYKELESGKYDIYIKPYSSWKDAKVIANKDSSYLFGNLINCTKINGLENLDTSNVTNMSYMFGTKYTAEVTTTTPIKSIDLRSLNTSKVTNMEGMFSFFGYNGLEGLDVSSFNTSNVTNMSQMFYGCGNKKLASLKLGENFDTSKVTNMEKMFRGTGNVLMESLDLGDKFDTSKVENMKEMFMNCGTQKMNELKLGNSFKNVPEENTDMFKDCGKADGAIYIVEELCVDNDNTKCKLNKDSNKTVTANRAKFHDINETQVHEHTWNEGVVTKEATCTEKGIKTYTCTVCSETRTEEIAALGHSYQTEFTVDKEPTCKEEGSKSKHCIRCEEKTDVTSIPATGHTWSAGQTTKEATCTEEGIVTYTCGKCGETKTGTIPALGHEFEEKFTVDTQATCTHEGSKSRHCIRCEEKTDVTSIPATGHTWSAEQTTKEATCTEEGIVTYTCTKCHEVKTNHIPALEHNYANGICTNCGEGIFVADSSYTIQDGKLKGLSIGTEVSTVRKNIKEEFDIKIIKNNKELKTGAVGTGAEVEITKDGQEIGKYIILIIGDCTGDGIVDIRDMVRINNYRLYGTTANFDEIYREAADTNKDGKVDVRDMVRINNYRLYGTSII